MKENRIPDKPWRTITWGGKADDSGGQLKKTDKKRHKKRKSKKIEFLMSEKNHHRGR